MYCSIDKKKIHASKNLYCFILAPCVPATVQYEGPPKGTNTNKGTLTEQQIMLRGGDCLGEGKFSSPLSKTEEMKRNGKQRVPVTDA